jgi:ketosteroid isomerase-like protein
MNTRLVKSACARWLIAVLAAMFLFAVSSSPSSAQQKNKKVKEAPQDDPNAPPMPPGSDADQIERAIGEMLAGFQLGDVELMHKHYADNVTFVSGAYEPPIVGWQNYVPLYQRQREGFQGIQLVRRNTFVFPHGDVAWAMYQWEFDSMLNGRPYTMQGQTTLVFNKIDGNWLIVHNHTSQIASTPAASPQAPTAAQQVPMAAPAKR